jgi:hypothetical protein
MSPIYVPGKVVLQKQFTQQGYMWEFPARYGLWSPANIATALWLDAADTGTVITESGAVSQWNDKSGNGRNATQSTAGNRPTYTANGLTSKNVITFNAGSSTRLSSALGAASAIESSFTVANASSANTGQQSLLASSAAGGRQFRLSSTTASFLSQATALLGTSSSNAPKDAAIIFNLAYSGGGTSLSFFFNGTSAGTATTGNSVSGGGTTSIGAQGGGSEGLTGYIAEIVVLQSAPSTDTRQRIEGYLAHKWGLTANLPAGHPYKTVGPTP